MTVIEDLLEMANLSPLKTAVVPQAQLPPAAPQQTPAQLQPADDAVAESAQCWAHQIANGATQCTPGFTLRAGHLKNKFCPACVATGFSVEPARAWLVPETQLSAFANNSATGFYTEKHGVVYRLINQTNRCKGPPIVLLKDAADASALPFGFAALPASMLQSAATPPQLHLSVVHGTLVPTAHLTTRTCLSPSEASAQDQGEGSISDNSEHVNKRRRAETEAEAETAPSLSAVSLLDMATLHAQAGSNLQVALECSAGSSDPAMEAYHMALLRALPALRQAGEALQQAINSHQGASTPDSGFSFPPIYQRNLE